MKTLSIALALVLTGGTLSIVSTPCATEDSTACYWNGDTRGNGQGHSYLSITDTITVRTK